ncbi:MAG: beta-ketoacyl synthase N-terminal-like domain-containing protein [Sulfurovaceae bacterium]|nr:beta-ketoacyl synthase N-terminal-like domain-containing protein [Sulfurovaceae bacterium]MDD5548505.1 beta-ketoacyl synthase N-terminal-like domain-containing protein [Sulfurovaceae bacterium]
MNAYVIEAVAFCALGNNEDEILANLQNPPKLDTLSFPFGSEVKNRPFGKMKIKNLDSSESLDDILNNLLKELINKSNLTSQELDECALLIGSTSANIASSEQQLKHGIDDNLPLFGYGYIAEKLAQKFGINLEVIFFTSACTSSANALLYAQRGINRGDFKRAIVIGFEFRNEFSLSGFEALGLLSATECRPFDKLRDGLVLGEGCSAVLLEDKPRDNSRFLCLCGGENRCDISSPTSHALNGVMVAKTIKDALSDANITAEEISIIKSHGTGSLSSDEAEENGLTQVFTSMPYTIALKPFLGHTLGACGVIELSLLWFSLQNGFLPKNIELKQSNKSMSKLDILDNDNVYIVLNHFGFGGNGTVLILNYRVKE